MNCFNRELIENIDDIDEAFQAMKNSQTLDIQNFEEIVMQDIKFDYEEPHKQIFEKLNFL